MPTQTDKNPLASGDSVIITETRAGRCCDDLPVRVARRHEVGSFQRGWSRAGCAWRTGGRVRT